jgi:hypothetical protein
MLENESKTETQAEVRENNQRKHSNEKLRLNLLEKRSKVSDW